MPEGERKHRVDARMLELLVCPLTKGLLSYDAERDELVSKSALLAYPVRDGIPVLLPSEARVLDDEALPPAG
jgi:hypothetical protein